MPYNGFNAPVTVTIGPIPDDITISPTTFTIPSPTHSPNLTITVPEDLPPRPVSIPVQATSGTLSHSITWTINVLLNGPVLNLEHFAGDPHAGSFTTVYVDVTTNAGSNTIGTSALSVISAPAGITVSPLLTTFTGQGAQLFNIQATPNAQNGNITFQDTWNGVTVTATLPITVLAATSNSRTSTHTHGAYIRSSSTADYRAFPLVSWSLYDAGTARFFAADYATGRLNVYDSVAEKQIASLVIPGAFGIGQSSGDHTIYVGTLSGDIYLVDPVALTITQRIPSFSIGSSGFAANAVFPRQDGTLLLESYSHVPGFPSADGSNHFALWNPATNALLTVPGCNTGSGPARTLFGIPTSNGARLLTLAGNPASAATLLCSIDLTTGNFSNLTADSEAAINTLAVCPDGNTVAGFDRANIWVVDAATLAVKNKFPVPASGSLSGDASMLITPDNQTVYITGADKKNLVLAFNLSTGQLIGSMPAIPVDTDGSDIPSAPIPQGLSSNGLLGGVLEQGFAFIDTTAINPPPTPTTSSQRSSAAASSSPRN